MWKGEIELNGKTYIVDIEWSGKRGTYNQWWRTWCAEIVDGKIPRRYWGSYWNYEDWKPLCECVEVGYYTPYPLKTKAQVLAALDAMLARSKTRKKLVSPNH